MTHLSRPHRTARLAAGYTLVELMVAMVITMLVLIAGLSFYLMSRSSYTTIDDKANLEERGHFATSVITRLIRQTAFSPAKPDTGGLMEVSEPNLLGKINCAAPSVSADEKSLNCVGASVNNSDALMIRYFGVSTAADPNIADESVVDCSGRGVPAYREEATSTQDRGMSILYVRTGESGKPALWCKSRHRTGNDDPVTEDEELVPGVETIRALYGVTVDGDEVVDKYVTADQLATNEDWKKVLTVQVSMVVRTDNASADAEGAGAAISLFGPMSDITFTPTEDLKSARKLYTTTVQLSNYLSCLSGDPTCIP